MGCTTSHETSLRHATRHNPENFAQLARACYAEAETGDGVGSELTADERRDLLDELPSHDSKGEGEEATSSTPLAAAFPQSQWGKQWVQWRTERWTKEHMSTSTPDSPETPSKRAPPPASSAPLAAEAIALPESVVAESVAAAGAASTEWRLDVDEAESKEKS